MIEHCRCDPLRGFQHLLRYEGIVRHRGKIEARIHNVARDVELQSEQGSLATYFLRCEPPPAKAAPAQTQSTSAESVALSKNLKRLGWKCGGSTTVLHAGDGAGQGPSAGGVIAARGAAARQAFRSPRPPGAAH